MIRKILLLNSIIFTSVIFAQTNCEAKQKENSNLKIENEKLRSENEYLRKVFDINKPIMEVEKDKNSFRITKITGNKSEKTISITFLVEAKDENKQMYIQDFSIIDLEGNEYAVDLFKSTNTLPKLSSNVPYKVMITFVNIEKEPKFIKILRFGAGSDLERNPFEHKKSLLEFRDLNVSWN